MTTRLELHALAGTKRAGELAELVERLYRQRRRVVVWVADQGRMKILDDYLWSFRTRSFLPHAVWSPELGELDEPVVLVGEAANPNRSDVLVVGDELPPSDWAAGFSEVHDLIPPGVEGEERREHWRRWQLDHGAEGVGE